MADDSDPEKLIQEINRYRALRNACTDEKMLEHLQQLIDEAQAKLDAL